MVTRLDFNQPRTYSNLSKRLYVGGLPYQTTEEELKELFSEYGSVESATIINDKYSGRSKGFGFVEMVNDEEAQKAIDSLNGYKLGERNIIVNEARPLGEKKGGFERRRNFRRRF